MFFKLHALNILLALYYSLFGAVVVFYTPNSRFLLKRFKRLDPEDHVDFDGWEEFKREASYLWVDIAENISRREWEADILGYRVDFSNIAQEAIGKEFENLAIFMGLITKMRRAGDNCCLVEPGLLRFASTAMPREKALKAYEMVRKSNLAVMMDYLHEGILSFLYFGQFLLRTAKLFFPVKTGKSEAAYKYFWAGINPTEQCGQTNKLDFAWAAERHVLPPADVLYFLPSRLTPEAAERYRGRKINYREPGKYFEDIKGPGAIKPLWQFARSLMRCKTGILSPFHGQLIFRFVCQSYLWGSLAEQHKPGIYFTTQSSIWPERPEVAVFNAMGIRTVMWSYSANYMLYRTEEQIGDDAQIAMSAIETREILVWNELSADWLKSRIINGNVPEIKIVGPTMNGDSRICLRPPSEARDLLGIKQTNGSIYVSIFDIPTIAKDVRIDRCLGPTPYPGEMVTAFYYDMLKLVEDNPELVLLFKPKRSFNQASIEYSEAIIALNKEGKVTFMDPDINPYLPIAASDICIAMPFTSPVLAGIHFGKVGLYHDPLGKVRSHMYHEMDNMISHDYDELATNVEFWLSAEGKASLAGLCKRGELNGLVTAPGAVDPTESFGATVLGRPV